MTKHYARDTVTILHTVESNGIAATPSSISFRYREGKDGTIKTATPSATSTGYYAVEVTPETDQAIYYEWTTETPNKKKQGSIRLEKDQFVVGTGDYS